MAYTTINKPSDYFNTKLYTGTGSTDTAITGVGFQPDWVWTKSRSNAYDHKLYDSVRGANIRLISNSNSAETTQTEDIKSFDSDGFTLGNDGGINGSGITFASWNWLAGGTPSSNTDGTITSTVSANTTSGFSIGTYSGNGTSDATIGHGLSSAPEMIIVKRRTGLDNWQVYWNAGTERNGFLNLTNAFNTPAATAQWGTNEPTSSVFYVGNDNSNNASSNDYVFYAFHSVKGYSKFGEYTGNASTDGPFVYTGFRPAFVLIKNATSGGTHWRLADTKRTPFNTTQNLLFPSTNAAESTTPTGTGNDFQIFSNGFKLTTDNIYANESGSTFIYMCFAENPLVTTGKVPATAR